MHAGVCKEILEKKQIQQIVFSMKSNTISLCRCKNNRKWFAFSPKEVEVQIDVVVPVLGKQTTILDFGDLYLKPEHMPNDGKDMLTVQLNEELPRLIRTAFAVITKIIGHSVRLYKMTELADHPQTEWKTLP